MEDNNSNSTSNLLIGLLIGAAIGATIGILFAPKPGHETRAIIKEKAMTAKEKAAELAQKAKIAALNLKKGNQAAT
jgi:gas vesicle protein